MSRLIALFVALMLSVSPAQAFEINIDKIVDAFKKTKDLKTVDEKGEVEIGDGVAANLLGAAPLVQDDKLQAYVNRLGWWLVQQTERPELPWHFGVLDTDSVNAFAAPGGYVFVTRGLLLHMHNEAELAGVMAHEISHVLKRHHLLAIQKNARIGIGSDLADMAVGSSQYGELKSKAISVSNELYARGLDKDDEFEADSMGIVIAARAGYDPYGLPAVLLTLEAMNAQDSSLALMFKTHPAPQKRLELLDGLMTGTMERYANQPLVADRFEQVVGDYARQGH